MDGERGHLEIQGLLAAYCLGAVTPAESAEVQAHVATCEACRDDLQTYEAATAGLTGALDRVWARVSSTLAGRREDLDCFLGDVTAGDGGDGELTAPICVLVAADTEAARLVLATRLDGDDRFSVVATAGSPSELLAEGVVSLPDVVVLKLASTDRTWLEAVGELTAWAPRTRLVAVSGLNARHLADLVTSPPVVRSLAVGRPPGADMMAARPGAGPTASLPLDDRQGGAVEAPRSIIHEVMRHLGLAVGGER